MVKLSKNTYIKVVLTLFMIFIGVGFLIQNVNFIGNVIQNFSVSICVNTAPVIKNVSCPSVAYEGDTLNCYITTNDPDLNQNRSLTMFELNGTHIAWDIISFNDTEADAETYQNYTDNGTIKVTLMQPYNGTRFTGGAWVTFNYKVNYNQTISNCSLYTNHTGTWSRVSTDNSVKNNTVSSFSIYNIPDLTTFKWNVKCYGNNSDYDFGDYNKTVKIRSVDKYSRATLDDSHLGNHSILFLIDDGSQCSNNQNSFIYNLNVLSAGNHPPYLVRDIPNQKWMQDTTLVAFNLDYDRQGYFDDPDGDPLTYRVDPNSNIQITIDSNHLVTFVPKAGYYGIEYVYFYATDPYNLSATSNRVKLEVQKLEQPTPPETSQKTDDSYKDRSSIPLNFTEITCFPDWNCSDWSICLPQGFQVRRCNDLNRCNSSIFKPNLTQACDYIPKCDDGIQNGDEQGIDCGGHCYKQCLVETCFDGIKNQNEVGIDCGGVCDECKDIMTCYDGVKNGDEENVDCGGSCSKKCSVEESPSQVSNAFGIAKLLQGLLSLFLTGILSYYAYAKRRLLKHWYKLLIKLFRKKQAISIDKPKRLLKSLDEIEANLLTSLPNKSMSHLSDVISDYISSLLENYNLTNEEIIKMATLIEIDPNIKEIIISLFNDLNEIVYTKKEMSLNSVQEMVFEVRNLILNTTFEKLPSLFSRVELKQPKGDIAHLYDKLTDLNVWVLNNNLEKSKSIYLYLLNYVRNNSIKDKYLISSIHRAYKLLMYKNEKR